MAGIMAGTRNKTFCPLRVCIIEQMMIFKISKIYGVFYSLLPWRTREAGMGSLIEDHCDLKSAVLARPLGGGDLGAKTQRRPCEP